MSAHTKGPWSVAIHEPGKVEPAFAVVRAVDSVCAMRHSPDYSLAEFFANARLLSAAPDLYEACAEALQFLEASSLRGTRLHQKLAAALDVARNGRVRT